MNTLALTRLDLKMEACSNRFVLYFSLDSIFKKLEIHSYIMAMLYCTSAVATEAISNYFEFLSNSGFIYLFCNTVK